MLDNRRNSDIKTNVNVEEINYQMCYCVHNMFEEASKRANGRIGKNKDERGDSISVESDGGYKCLHLRPEKFFWFFETLIKKEGLTDDRIRGMSFLDIGCGVGEKVFFAETLGFDSFGLELRRALLNEANDIYNKLQIDTKIFIWNKKSAVCDERYVQRFIQGNALTYDYSKFDVLYFYCPLSNIRLQQKLEKQIVKTAKPGAIVVPVLPRGCFRKKMKGWRHSDDVDSDGSHFYFVKE